MNHIGRYVLLVVLAVTAGSQPMLAQRMACYGIQPGDTAAHVALRITGNAKNRLAPWFQIVNPVASRFIAKAHYDHIRPGWRACIVDQPVTSRPRRVHTQMAAATRVEPIWAGIVRMTRRIDVNLIWWGALVVMISLVCGMVDQYATDRQTVLGTMRSFGERFIREFERPLIQQHLPGCPIQSRLRFSPHRARLDVLLAPNGGWRYPNLSDHKNNVEYDVTRVLQLLRDQPFVSSGPLYAQGRWVVVPFQFTVSPK